MLNCFDGDLTNTDRDQAKTGPSIQLTDFRKSSLR